MTDKITKHTLFRATRSQSETKADVTNDAARAIIAAETESRDAKTARLRQTRLERAESTPEPAPVKSRARKTASKPAPAEA